MIPQNSIMLDRNGTLIEEKNYLSSPDQVQILEGVIGTLLCSKENHFVLLVVTNQSALGSFLTKNTLNLIHQRLLSLLQKEGIQIDGIYYCPHLPEDHYLCHKPKTGLVGQTMNNFHFAPSNSYVIGDKACDIELGKNLGATTILVETGYRKGLKNTLFPDYVTESLYGAARVTINRLANPKESSTGFERK